MKRKKVIEIINKNIYRNVDLIGTQIGQKDKNKRGIDHKLVVLIEAIQIYKVVIVKKEIWKK